jgi:hypothetical protein
MWRDVRVKIEHYVCMHAYLYAVAPEWSTIFDAYLAHDQCQVSYPILYVFGLGWQVLIDVNAVTIHLVL